MFSEFIKYLEKHPFIRFLVLLLIPISLYLGFATFLDLHFHKTFTKWYSREDKSEQKPKVDTTAITELINNNKDTSFKVHVDSALNNLQKQVRDIQGLDSSEDISNSNVIDFKIVKLEEVMDSTFSEDKSTIRLTAPTPKNGYGKLAIRSFCDYCTTALNISVNAADSTNAYIEGGSVSPMYDTLRKSQTTFVTELLPGKYKLELDYRWQGKSYKLVQVFKGKASIYNVRKTNPFGTGNGQIVLKSSKNRIWKITVDENLLGNVKMKPKQALYLNLPPGRHQIKVEKTKYNFVDLDENFQKVSIDLEVGERIVKEIY